MGGMDSALRRINVEEPVSRLAILSTKFAKLALLLAAVALVASHARGALARFFAILTLRPSSAPDPGIGLFFFTAALAVAALAIVLALAAAASMWVRGAVASAGSSRPSCCWRCSRRIQPISSISAGNPPWLADVSTDWTIRRPS